MPRSNITITCRLGADPTISTTKTGKKVGNVRVYVLAKSVENGEYGNSLWFKLVCWDEWADTLSTFGKGDRVTARGRLGYEKWKDYINYIITVDDIESDDFEREG